MYGTGIGYGLAMRVYENHQWKAVLETKIGGTKLQRAFIPQKEVEHCPSGQPRVNWTFKGPEVIQDGKKNGGCLRDYWKG